MGEITRVGPDFNAALMNEPETLSDAEIQERMTADIGESGGVQSIAFNANGEVIDASSSRSSYSVNTGSGSPSSIYQMEINDLQNQLDNLITKIRGLTPGDPEYQSIIKEMGVIEEKAGDLKRKEQQSIEASDKLASANDQKTISNLRASLALQEEAAANRKEDKQRKQAGLPPKKR